MKFKIFLPIGKALVRGILTGALLQLKGDN